jgi:hypothetical protein
MIVYWSRVGRWIPAKAGESAGFAIVRPQPRPLTVTELIVASNEIVMLFDLREVLGA